ncbi:hypothetical protein PS9374_07222 [Planomonospora sphaerica]|uniref:Uncharacterized protein n=1 Tax=Planomonospora sphaerica TaxID=161355 RepID=A0A161LZJ2_9ACTN|nr:hypothetical protein PS9374_07222 [Planomonospora sphaerica]
MRRASDNRSTSSTPTPSEQPVPSASAENALHRPSAARPRWVLKYMNMSGAPMTVTPPASASEHSPDRTACAARCNATSDDEHAVSTDTDGPSRPSVYDTRPDTRLPPLVVPASTPRP